MVGDPRGAADERRIREADHTRPCLLVHEGVDAHAAAAPNPAAMSPGGRRDACVGSRNACRTSAAA